MEKTKKSSADHIASLPAEQRPDMKQLDALITELMADLPKTMWEGKFWGGSDQQIIGYGDYTFQQSNGETVEWFIIGLAAQKKYISIYVNATDNDHYLTEKYTAKLGRVKVGKSSISFNTINDIELDQLALLITDARRLMT